MQTTNSNLDPSILAQLKGLELLEIDLVCLAKDFPIDIPKIVARGVLAMLGELGRLSTIGAAVHS